LISLYGRFGVITASWNRSPSPMARLAIEDMMESSRRLNTRSARVTISAAAQLRPVDQGQRRGTNSCRYRCLSWQRSHWIGFKVPSQRHSPVGREHGRTIPLAEMRAQPSPAETSPQHLSPDCSQSEMAAPAFLLRRAMGSFSSVTVPAPTPSSRPHCSALPAEEEHQAAPTRRRGGSVRPASTTGVSRQMR
jgi:hypothetical protein